MSFGHLIGLSCLKMKLCSWFHIDKRWEERIILEASEVNYQIIKLAKQQYWSSLHTNSYVKEHIQKLLMYL